jgi:D-xylose transport system ATP-binding protein
MNAMHGVTLTASPVLRVTGAVKRFGAILALDNVSLEVRRGEILALLGDNGAGKSTLIKCISGVHTLDSGEIALDGRPVTIQSPADARALGIETVYQDLALFDNLAADMNFYAGRELAFPTWLPRPLRFLSRGEMDMATRGCLERLKVSLRASDTALGLLSGGQRQAIAVARAAAFASKLVILDEPTAALGLRESRQVLDLIKLLRDEGNAVILITHNMEHVTELADRAVIMRQGRKVGDLKPDGDHQREIVALIVGAEDASRDLRSLAKAGAADDLLAKKTGR